MPEMTIRLRINPETNKKDIIISLRGDEDALPHEHEQMHRKLVEKVLSGNKIKMEEIGQITVEREGSDKPCCVAEWIVRYYPESGRTSR